MEHQTLDEALTVSTFDQWRKRSGALLAPAAFLVTLALTQHALAEPGQKLAAVLAGVAVLWITETIPLPATALLGVVLCVVLGVAPAKTVLAPFADPIVFLFIGSFILARAMTLHGLDRRFALMFLSQPWVAGKPRRMLCVMGLATATLSMWVSNTATTAMMTPIAVGILDALHELGREDSSSKKDLRSSPFAVALLLMVAYSASIGGIGTPVGSPPNLITVGQLRERAHVTISFFEWMALCVPLLIAMGGVLFVLLAFLQRAELPWRSTGDLAVYFRSQSKALGEWTRGQINTLVAFGIAVTGWITPGIIALLWGKDDPWAKFFEERLPESVVALGAALLLFVLPTDVRRGQFTINWQQAVRIDWGTILLFGGGMSLGSLMFETKVAETMGHALVAQAESTSVWFLTAVAIVTGLLCSEMASNTAAANMIVPVIVALSQAANVSPVPPAMGACLGASYGFMLPVSTPPNAIVYGTGRVPLTKMFRAGLLFDLSGIVIIFLGLRILCPLLGWM